MHPYGDRDGDGAGGSREDMEVEEEFETPQNSIKVSGTQDVREVRVAECNTLFDVPLLC